jgi:hypothetical protein
MRAVVEAQHEAPRVFLQRLWQRIGPAAIEAQPHAPGWKLRGEAVDWWETYKRAVATMGPDVARDQMRELVRELVREILGKAPARRTSA